MGSVMDQERPWEKPPLTWQERDAINKRQKLRDDEVNKILDIMLRRVKG